MGIPNRTSYMANVVSRLEGIQAGATPPNSTEVYRSSVNSVVRRIKNTNVEVRPEDRPQIQVWMLSDASTAEYPSLRIDIEQDFDLFVILSGEDSDATGEDVDDIREDIMAALLGDHTQGGFVDSTHYVGSFEGIHPDVEIGQLRMQFRVKRRRSIRRD